MQRARAHEHDVRLRAQEAHHEPVGLAAGRDQMARLHLVRQRDERRRHRHGQNERPAVGGNRQDDDRRHGQAYGTGRRTRQPDERDARGDGDRQDRHHDEARGYAQAVFEAGQQH